MAPPEVRPARSDWWSDLAEKYALRLGPEMTPERRKWATIWAGVLTVAILITDFFAGYEISLRFAYCIPLTLMVAARGPRPALVLAVFCDAGWQIGDLLAGAHYSSAFVPAWNLFITLVNYVFVILLLAGLFSLQRELDRRVQARTRALNEEVQLRERLEREMMHVAENERRSVGHDLHDSLGQHFTATALAAQSLARRLEKEGHQANDDARRVVLLVEQGIEQTRRLAKGLVLLTVEGAGLATALRELAAVSEEQLHVPCSFELTGEPAVTDMHVATHLFRIFQEAMHHAVRQGRATRLGLAVAGEQDRIRIRLTDNGGESRSAGTSLRIMEHRAKLIEAAFKLTPLPAGGMLAECSWQAEEDPV